MRQETQEERVDRDRVDHSKFASPRWAIVKLGDGDIPRLLTGVAAPSKEDKTATQKRALH